MNEEKLNQSIRKFLKQVGVTSQREIELAVRAASEKNSLPDRALPIKVTLECPMLDLKHDVEGQLET